MKLKPKMADFVFGPKERNRQMTKKFWILMLALIMGLAVAFACGGGGDDDDDDDDDGPGMGDPGVLHGFVRDFQTKVEVNNAFVEAIDDEFGLPFSPAITTTTGPDGEVSFDIPAGNKMVGIRVTKEGSMDTIQFHFDVGLANEEFLLINHGTRDLMLLSLGLDMIEGKAVVAGGVYWGEPIDENPIGCSMVSFDPDDGQEVYYFGPDALPNAARTVDGDTPTNGQGTLDASAQADGHALSYYVSLNKDPVANVTLNATLYDVENADLEGAKDDDDDTTGDDDDTTGDDDDTTGDDDVDDDGPSFTSENRDNDIPMLYPDSATIVNVYFSKDDYASNPTPAWCTE
jgi:hypothetical protein